MSDGQGDGSKEDYVSLNALTAEELGAIISNEKYRQLLGELLPQYEEDLKDKSGKHGASEGNDSGFSSGCLSYDEARDTLRGYEPSGEGTPAPPSRKRKRRASEGESNRNAEP